MALIETEAIVLRTYDLGDADKIVVTLTQHHGLVRGVAKGAKRLKSKFGGTLEPFSIVLVTYLQKEERELVTIQHIELIRSFFKIASEPLFLQKFAYLVDLLGDFAPPHEPNERLFKMAKICLETAAESSLNIESIAFYFEYWILWLGGYLPDWEHCGSCRREFVESDLSRLQLDYYVNCAGCNRDAKNPIINPNLRELFNITKKYSPARFVEYAAGRNVELIELSGILKSIISRILDREVVIKKSYLPGPGN